MAKSQPSFDAAASSAAESTAAPATPPVAASAEDVASLMAELRAQRSDNEAKQSQMDQALDALIDAREEIDRLKAGIGIAPTGRQDGRAAVVSALDAELADLKEEFKEYPLIQVFEQRAVLGMDASHEIRLTDEASLVEDPTGAQRRWKLRWFNFAKEGRAHQAAAEGYEKVRWDWLSDQESITGARMDEFVRKGDRGLEVLHRMPLKLYNYKKRRDAAIKAGVLTSESGLRDMVANKVAGIAGNTGGNADQAGSTVSNEFEVTITPGQRETVTM